MLEQRVGIIFVIMSSFAFAFVPNSAKLALDDGASLFFIVYSRYIIGTTLLTIFMIIKRKRLILQSSQIIQILLPSLSALVLIFCTYHAVNYVEVGVVLLILYMFPLGVALICFIQGKEQINGKQWLLMIAVFLGLAILLLDDLQSTDIYGLFISFCGLLSFIFFIILSSKQVSKLGSTTFNLYLCFFGIITMTALLLIPGDPRISLPESVIGYTAILGNGLFFIISWVLFFEGARIIGSTRASLLACAEPLFAALLAIILLNQTLSAVEWLGFGIVLTSILFFEKNSSKQKKTHKLQIN